MNNYKILVVEDDLPILNLIVTTLKVNDYLHLVASNGKEALQKAVSSKPDIILLDLGLPDMDGVEVIENIRTWSNVPIIVISARNEDSDKILALDAGADDYLTKPFSVDELLARLRVTIRRLSMINQDYKEPIFINGQLRIDYSLGCVNFGDHELHLTPIEYKLLVLLAKNVGRVLTHQYITQTIWGTSWDSDLVSLRVHMATLRKKIEKDEHNYIQTHVGIGYRMLKI